MRLIDETKSVIGRFIDIGIVLLVLAIVLLLLIGPASLIFDGVRDNILAFRNSLGLGGLAGGIVLGLVLWLFARYDGAPHRRRLARTTHRNGWMNWLVLLMILGASVAIAVVGFASGEDLNALLGQWRTGVVLLAGTALLFLHAVWLQSLLRFRSDVEDVADRQAANRELLSDIGRRLGPRRASKRG
jgi:hypothetical protein